MSDAPTVPMKDGRDAILARVQFDPNGGCWLWAGWLNGWSGYGRLNLRGREVTAHRAAYEAFKGEIGDRWVLHKCDVRVCVNPDHLYLGDHADNTADMVRRNRMCRKGAAKGEASPTAKLTEAQVREIRASPESSYALAKRLPVTDSLIRRIRRKGAWAHV